MPKGCPRRPSRHEHGLVGGGLLVAIQLLNLAPDELAAHAGLAGVARAKNDKSANVSLVPSLFLPLPDLPQPTLPHLDHWLQREGQGIQVLRLHVGPQHARSVLEKLLPGRSRCNSLLCRTSCHGPFPGRTEPFHFPSPHAAVSAKGSLASMIVTRKWLARSRPAARPEKLPPITSTRRLNRSQASMGLSNKQETGWQALHFKGHILCQNISCSSSYSRYAAAGMQLHESATVCTEQSDSRM